MNTIGDSTLEYTKLACALRRHDMETFPSLLAFCEGNSFVTVDSSHVELFQL